jgi:hypothetical protein
MLWHVCGMRRAFWTLAILLVIALQRVYLRYPVARLEGLEPPAGCLEGSCSIRLSYRRPHAPSAHCARLISRLGHASVIEPVAVQNVSSVPCPGLPQARS